MNQGEDGSIKNHKSWFVVHLLDKKGKGKYRVMIQQNCTMDDGRSVMFVCVLNSLHFLYQLIHLSTCD